MSKDDDRQRKEPVLGQNVGALKPTQDEVARLMALQAESWRRIDAMPDTEERRAKREAFQQDAVRAWEEYRRTGLHVTGEEMDRWMASLGTDHELPPPECHT